MYWQCPWDSCLLLISTDKLLTMEVTLWISQGKLFCQLSVTVSSLCSFQNIPQGSYRSWKTWKVMEFYNFIFQAWKVLKFGCGSWKVMENQYDIYECKAIRSKVEKLTDESKSHI